MMYVMNIVSPTKDSDLLYSQVALNTYPIVWYTDEAEITELYESEDLISALKNIVKTEKVYDKAEVYYRQFDDDMELVKQDKFKLKDHIKIEFKK